jgi:peptidoglycan/LPS O-acetylase OafA/YrhL
VPPRWVYQPALDGVRALAVAAVLIFHGYPGWLPGGFLGVDAFFVLSGFLITSLLLSERERTGRISLARFWARRARRLLPALLLVLVAVAVLARYTLAAEELAALRRDALAALGYVANWRMVYRGGDYFAQTAAASPLQHTWSLGIEEQFYLAWPLLLVFLFRRRPAVLAAAATGVVASGVATASLYRPAADPGRVYYGTDTRAGALLLGCALAAVLADRPVSQRSRRVIAVVGALGAVTVTGAWLRASGGDAWLYRGGLTGLGLAVAAVLAHLVTAPDARAARVLSLPPLVWLGRISYGVYLWHWPLFLALTADRLGFAGPGLFAVRVAVTLLAATASYHLVERPIRDGRVPTRVLAPATATAVGAVTGVIVIATVVPVVPAATVAPRGEQTAAAGKPTEAPILRTGRHPGTLPRITILGDSVAWTLGAYLLPHPELEIANRAVQGCGIARLPDIWYVGSPHTNYPGCTAWDERWRASIATYDPDVAVILLDRWELMDRRLGGRYQHLGDPDYDAYVTGELTLAIGIAASAGARVVLLTAPYTRRQERPDGGLWPEDTPDRVRAWNRLLVTVAAATPTHPTILDLNHVVCPDDRFTWTVSGIRVRSDGLHFTPAGVQRIIAPWLLPQLRALATG